MIRFTISGLVTAFSLFVAVDSAQAQVWTDTIACATLWPGQNGAPARRPIVTAAAGLAAVYAPANTLRKCIHATTGPTPYFALEYNKALRQPVWVAYKLDVAKATTIVNQSPNLQNNSYYIDCCVPDPLLRADQQPAPQLFNNYHRGHMAPNLSMSFSPIAHGQSMLYTNIALQAGGLNTGKWGAWEQSIRAAAASGDVYVVVGTLYNNAVAPTVIGPAAPGYFVAKPDSFFMAIYRPGQPVNTRCRIYVVPNAQPQAADTTALTDTTSFRTHFPANYQISLGFGAC